MKLRFNSKFIQGESKEPQEVFFDVETKYFVNEFTENNKTIKYDTYQFIDPVSKKITNIEVSPEAVNLFSGEVSLNLRKNKKQNNWVQVDKNNKFEMVSILRSVETKKRDGMKVHNIKYQLFSLTGSDMGKFHLTLSELSDDEETKEMQININGISTNTEK